MIEFCVGGIPLLVQFSLFYFSWMVVLIGGLFDWLSHVFISSLTLNKINNTALHMIESLCYLSSQHTDI